jgi:hypothetical protein
MEHPIIITSDNDITTIENIAKQNIIANLLNSTAGRQALASSMAQPIRRSLDYKDIARRGFPVAQLTSK